MKNLLICKRYKIKKLKNLLEKILEPNKKSPNKLIKNFSAYIKDWRKKLTDL